MLKCVLKKLLVALPSNGLQNTSIVVATATSFSGASPDARHLFEGRTAVSVSFGDVSLRCADHLAAAHRRETDSLIAQARDRDDPTAGVPYRLLPTTPSQADMDRAVRVWVSEQIAALIEIAKANREEVTRQTRPLVRLTQEYLRADYQAALMHLRWVMEALVARHNWRWGDDGPAYLLDRLGRAQREIVSQVSAELNFDDPPAPTHRMFDPTAFAMDQAQADAPTPHILRLTLLSRMARAPTHSRLQYKRAAGLSESRSGR